jgi:hypothetical protein
MKLLTANTKMADAIHSNYMLIPVVNRFGIRLGFGEKTIATVCSKLDIDVECFLATPRRGVCGLRGLPRRRKSARVCLRLRVS